MENVCRKQKFTIIGSMYKMKTPMIVVNVPVFKRKFLYFLFCGFNLLLFYLSQMVHCHQNKFESQHNGRKKRKQSTKQSIEYSRNMNSLKFYANDIATTSMELNQIILLRKKYNRWLQ